MPLRDRLYILHEQLGMVEAVQEYRRIGDNISIMEAHTAVKEILEI